MRSLKRSHPANGIVERSEYMSDVQKELEIANDAISFLSLRLAISNLIPLDREECKDRAEEAMISLAKVCRKL